MGQSHNELYKPVTECEVSEWSAWSACVRSPACPRPAGPSLRGKAHRMGVTAGYDVGRRHMMQNVKVSGQRKVFHSGTELFYLMV